jgi:hypothetical protein
MPAAIIPGPSVAQLLEWAHLAKSSASREARELAASLLVLEVLRLLEPRSLGAGERP